MKAKLTSGRVADARKLEDDTVATMILHGDSHKWHLATLSTAKHNCGAYEVNVVCECGKTWQNEMNGCWQRNHQREEVGDNELGRAAKIVLI